jgi:cytochrome c oxidase accessory protein FixG
MKQKALDKREWDSDKIFRKTAKHIIFFVIAFIISNTFLSYIIGIDEWKKIVSDDPGKHVAGLISILVFTGIFYGVYARFREQVCIVVCPYGRLQGVLLDPNSVIVGYDYNRGEPRGKLKHEASVQTGDCIDCHLCVNVCPTGIDIRNGTQLECINCTACIDACDSIMEKIQKPSGLIRYTSENSIKNGIKFKITSRVAGYIVVLSVLLITLITLLVMRSDISTTVLRTPGLMYQKTDDTHISNIYNIQLVNKTFNDIPVEVRVIEPAGIIKWVGNGISNIKEQSVTQGEFFLIIPKSGIVKTKTIVKFDIYSNGKKLDHTETSFLGPNY